MKSEKRYQGRPCKYGHPGIRYVASRHCVECAARKRDEYWTKTGKAQAPAKHRAKKYGLTGPAFSALLARSRCSCEVCLQPLEVGGIGPHGLAVDHCHMTGRVRGLLCNNCNRGLGLFGDDPQRLQAAATYLNEMKK